LRQYLTSYFLIIKNLSKNCHPEFISGSKILKRHSELGSGSKSLNRHSEFISESTKMLKQDSA